MTSESEWLRALSPCPVWQVPLRHTVVVSPHPDDETLGCGGLIYRLAQKGCEVTVIAVTDGENCYPGEDLGAVRRAEQEAALRRLGVSSDAVYRLRLPDTGLPLCEETLESQMASVLPADVHLVAPWVGDFHPDHEACGRVAKRLASRLSLALTTYFFWTWHRGTPELVRDLPLVRLALEESEQVAKREALLCHRSQLEHASGEPILPCELLGPAWRTFEVFLPA